MKKLLLFIVMACSVLTAAAKVEFQSVNNHGHNTTVVFTISEDEKDLLMGLSVENIVLVSDGEHYKAKKVDADFGKTTVVTAKFKRLTKFVNARITFILNGEPRSIPLIGRRGK